MTVIELDELEARKYVDISIGPDGDRWALNEAESVEGLFGKGYRLYYRKAKGKWESKLTYPTWITATGNGKCWYGRKTTITEYDHNTGKVINRVANLAKSGSSNDDVGISKSGNVWIADKSKNKLWEWNGSSWEQRAGNPSRITITDDNRPWAVIGGRLFEWDGTKWIDYNMDAVDIDHSYGGKLWVIRVEFGQQIVARIVDGEWEDIITVKNAVRIKRDERDNVVWVKSKDSFWNRIEIPFDWSDLMTKKPLPY